MRILITNETGFTLYAVYPKQADLEGKTMLLEFRLTLTEPDPIAGYQIKELKGPPLCSGLDFPKLGINQVQIALTAPKGTTIEAEDGLIPDTDGTVCHMVRIRKLEPKLGGN